MSEKPILIQGAMKVETDILISNLEDREEIVLNGYVFYKGKINNVPVVVSRTKVGIVNSAVATILAINAFKPRCVINQGVAGGHNECVHRGDIVLGEFASNMNSYKTMELRKGEGIKPDSWHLMTYNEGNDIEKEKIVADSQLLNKAFKFFNENNINVHKGTIVSGDGWNKEYDRIMWFVNELDSFAEDMETYPVYKICRDNNVPVLGVRMISNSEINEESYERGLAKILQENLIKMISVNII